MDSFLITISFHYLQSPVPTVTTRTAMPTPQISNPLGMTAAPEKFDVQLLTRIWNAAVVTAHFQNFHCDHTVQTQCTTKPCHGAAGHKRFFSSGCGINKHFLLLGVRLVHRGKYFSCAVTTMAEEIACAAAVDFRKRHSMSVAAD